MAKRLAIFGASGTQGGSLINFILNDNELSKEYSIRAIFRDANSEKAKLLKDKIEVVQGDITDPKSLEMTLTGVHTLFLITTPSLSDTAVEDELSGIKSVANIAVAKGVQYFIFSTLPAVTQISGGKYTAVTPFDAKALAETYIRTLPIKSAFVSLGSYMQNFQSQPYLAPRKQADGSYIMYRNVSPQAKQPLIDTVSDIGKFVGAILAEPDEYEGMRFCCATATYTFEEIVAAMSKSTAKKIVYQQVGDEEFEKGIGFPPQMKVLGGIFTEAFKYGEEFEYFGPGQEEAITWAVENARGKVTTLDEFLEANPFQLE